MCVHNLSQIALTECPDRIHTEPMKQRLKLCAD
jgi:hypothetical protein